MAVAVLVGLTAGIFAIEAWRTSVRIMPATTVRGTIERLGTVPRGEMGDLALVAARTPDGTLRQLIGAPERMRGCRVGGPVNLLYRQGSRWSLSDTPCVVDGREIE